MQHATHEFETTIDLQLARLQCQAEELRGLGSADDAVAVESVMADLDRLRREHAC